MSFDPQLPYKIVDDVLINLTPQEVTDQQTAAVAWAAGAAARQQAADLDTQTRSDIGTAKAYAKLTALAAMTPAQVTTYITNNVATLADAKDALTTLAIAVSILARRL